MGTNYTDLMSFFIIVITLTNEQTNIGIDFWLIVELLEQFEMIKVASQLDFPVFGTRSQCE